MTLPVTFLSDYGYDDTFAGVCRAVIARIAHDVQITDISHGVPRQDVRHGAIQLATALPYAAPGVHLAVVDPGVGSERLPLALRTREEDRLLVGPDNGLLMLAAEQFGGAEQAVDLTRSPFLLEPVSATFHGRDIFAPVAACLANGVALSDVGDEIDPGSLTTIEVPQVVVEDGQLTAHVLLVDTFGNAILNASSDHLAAAGLAGSDSLTVRAGSAERTVALRTTFADVERGELVIYFNASSALSLAANQGSAASALALALDDEIIFGRAG